MHPRRVACLALFALLITAGACSESPPGFADAAARDDLGDDLGDALEDARRDGAMDGGDARGRVCDRSTQCDDGVPCTQDFCGPDGRCVNLPNSRVCDDEVFCNGVESCDARRGCVRGAPVSCNDNYTCTIDRCDEPTKRCVHSPRDFDRDGDPDIHCMAIECGDAGVPEPDAGVPTACWRGGDCDDTNPRVSSQLPELCGDMIDNNCNGLVDAREPGGCMRPPHDRCEDALDVSRGGRFTVRTLGTAGDYPFRCAGGSMLMRDVVLRLRLDSPRDLSLTANTSGAAVYLAFETACGTAMPAEVRECTVGLPAVYRARNLPAGTYYILLGLSTGPMTAGDLDVTVDLTAATPPPTNDTCATPIVIPPTGGTFMGDLIGVADDVRTRCGGSNPDVVYSLTLTEPRDVTVRASGGRSDSVQVSLVDRCVLSPMTIRCDSAVPSQFIAHQLPAGTYYVIVEGRNVPMFTLDVTVTPATPPPPGDTCMDPLPLASGATVMGTLMGREGDVTLSCSGSSGRDVVYRFTLAERSDVNLTARGGTGDFFYLGVQTACGDRTTERGCRFGSPARLTARGLDPGTYFAVLRGTAPRDYSLTLDARPPLTPMAVMGNDTCALAAAIPSGGGLYTGTTVGLRSDFMFPCAPGAMAEDAVFRYHADVRQRVSFSLEGSAFDTVMMLTRADACPGMVLACNDDAIGLASAFELVVDPGDYYLYVGGFSTAARGAYTLTVLTTPP
ncbi:MAG: putative metal-binding motif-containing protein [Deltaproteobacteria bacterium]|nr:putative metal-binding motif-containing protein [Deltaproteobacteria bacterium]